ncbi:MAG: DUF4153 domain-containing protein [Rubrobacter sp.]
MGERTRLGLGIIGGALALGGLGDALLRATPWGVNLLLWVVILVGVIALLARSARVRPEGEGRWLVLVAVVFAAGVVVRDSPVVVFLDLLAVASALLLAAWRGRTGSLRRVGISGYALGGTYVGLLASAGPVPVSVSGVAWREVVRGRWKGQVLAVVRGLLIGAPLLLVFGGLFVAADAVFERLVLDVLGFDLEKVFGHLFLILVFAWVTAGLLWAALMARVPQDLDVRRQGNLSLGIVEVGIVMGLLDLLFLVFVVVQVTYLFGGSERVITSGLTYAEYARRGFFELVTVAALALPVLLFAHWILRTETRARERVFRALAGAMIGLLFVVVASALQRMYLYQQEFGLTELRLYTTIFMVWISLVLGWFVLTVLRGRRETFAFGALVAGFVAVIAINAINPDALIASTNLERARNGEELDAYYLTTLSADAAPVLVSSLTQIGDRPVGPDYTVEQSMLDRWGAARTDWRSWNLSRSTAHRLVESRLENGSVRTTQPA